ncbi:MAG: uridine diphosphate-N-acetylglucosamine-binding protein YvcK [Acidobacteria bacterium]|nr:uridine diphosphate-N-acetylglucosamine-binding protein YvcK [Acidobacteriota bacterium]
MNSPLRIVALGGGTGLSSLLSGLKSYSYLLPFAADRPTADITAIVTVTDDGGSSGRLRREFDVLPPGDIRNCMVALSEDDDLLSQLFQYRFAAGRGLKGHSFGNLFLTALTDVTGDFLKAIRVSSEVLAILGRIYPSTRSNVVLEAELASGERVLGESKIGRVKERIHQIRLKPKRVKPLKEALAAIEAADLITLGPGSLYTSVIPNLLVTGIPKAIRESRATKAYFSNLMWQPWETMHYSAADHVAAIEQHGGKGLVDCAIVNTRHIGGERRRLYAAEKVYPVVVDRPRLEAMGVEVIGLNMLAKGEKVRHDPVAAAAVAMELAQKSRLRRAAQA